MSKTAQIGFPPPLLGPAPLRLDVVYDEGSHLVVNKPQEVLVLSDNWYPRVPVLTEAINYQAAQGKAELERLRVGTQGLFAIYPLDPDISGAVLYARDEEEAVRLRNEFGSLRFAFTFDFVAEKAPLDDVAWCDLPLARHFTEPRMVVSSKTGKKAETQFQRLGAVGRYSLWRATTAYPRMHQVRLHAFECGLHVLGDEHYARSTVPPVSELKRNYRPGRKGEASLYDGPAIHLSQVAFPPVSGDTIEVQAPHSRRFAVLLKQLERFS